MFIDALMNQEKTIDMYLIVCEQEHGLVIASSTLTMPTDSIILWVM